MHRRNICHRDLCLRNMVPSYKDNAVVIADVGLAASVALFCLQRRRCAVRQKLFVQRRICWSLGVVIAALHVGQHLLTKAQDADQLQAYIDLSGPAENTWPTVTEMRL